MDLYGEKKNAVRTIVFLCAIMLLLTIVDLLPVEEWRREDSTDISVPVPKPTKETIKDGTFMREYESFVEKEFVSKDNWQALRMQMDVLRGVREINGVYLGKDDYLIEKHTEDSFSEENLQRSMDAMQKLLEEFPQAKLMAVPTTDNILTDNLPAFAPYYDQRGLLEQIKSILGEQAVIDVYDVMKAHAEEAVFYRTDREWTSLGAYYGYLEFAKSFYLPAKQYLKQEPVKVSEDFRGALYEQAGRAVDAEEIWMFPATADKRYTITYDGTKTTDTFYEPEYLGGEDPLGYFLDGLHAVTEIERESFSEKKLFIIKDGFGESMIPLLARHYKNVYVVDLSCYNDKLIDFMKECDENGDMDVLVLYDCVTFAESFRIP